LGVGHFVFLLLEGRMLTTLSGGNQCDSRVTAVINRTL
jgi:hypothetical protein